MQQNTPFPHQGKSARLFLNEPSRDRFLKYGSQVLSPIETLAVLFYGGNRWSDTVRFSQCLLSHFGGFRGLFAADNDDILKIKGMGRAKLAQIRAALEISRLYLLEEVKQSPQITNTSKVYCLIQSSIRDRAREEAWLLLLDNQQRLIKAVYLTSGTGNRADIYLQDIGREIFKHRATGLIFVHTHPSGEPIPSKEDKLFTRKIANFCFALDINFLDHIIVAQNDCYSFCYSGFLEDIRSKGAAADA